jgi:hypothetical protein
MSSIQGRGEPTDPLLDSRAAGTSAAAFTPGSTGQALRDGPQAFFALAAGVARVQFDPAEEWVGFLQALWEQLDAGFALTPDEMASLGVPEAWFDHPDDPSVVAWDRSRGEQPG